MNIPSRRSLPLLALACTASFAAAQSLVLPDNANLGAINSTQVAWRSTVGRFQVVYDSSHFTNAGVTGPVLLTRLRFRAEDGQPDLGGQTYTGVTVEVGNAVVDYSGLVPTFTGNRGTMGPLGTTNVTVQPCSGGVPNDYVIDIDLVAIGASVLYDPSTGTDLLIDISHAAPFPSANLVPIATGSPTVTVARARLVSSSAPGAATGGFGPAPAILVDFVGPGGYAASIPARVERFGRGCGGTFASFYQDFQVQDALDLSNTSLTLIPDNVAAPTSYLVMGGNTPPDLTKVGPTPASVADDAVVTHALGFTFRHPAGATTTIKPCTNGYVWLDAAMTLADSTPTTGELLGISVDQSARLCPYWYNFHAGRNTMTHPGAGLHVMTDTSGGPGNAVCYVTWYKVGVNNQHPVSGASISDLQCVFHEATGIVEMRLGAMNASPASPGVIGYSPGRVGGVPSKHPGLCDLSHELPIITQPDGAANALTHNTTAAARPIAGGSVTLQSSNQPAGTIFGLLCLDVAALQPNVHVPGLLAPGCGISVTPTFLIHEVVVNPPSTWTSAPIALPAGAVGIQFFSQYAALDANLLIHTSNGVKLTIGLN